MAVACESESWEVVGDKSGIESRVSKELWVSDGRRSAGGRII